MTAWPLYGALETVLGDVDAHLAAHPADPLALFLRGSMLRDLGRFDEALTAFERAVELDPAYLDATVALGLLLAQRWRRQEARDHFESLLERAPDCTAAMINLATLLRSSDPVRAGRLYESALEIDPRLQEAHEGLCVLAAARGDREAAQAHRRIAFAGRPAVLQPYRGRAWPIPALLLVSTDGGNLYAGHLLDDARFQTTTIYVEAFEPGTPLPLHRLIVNGIADADGRGDALERARAIAATSDAPLLNDPARVAATARIDNAARLARLAGVRTATIAPLDPGEPPAFPFLVRAPGFHMGLHFELVENAGRLEAALARFPARDALAIEYIDTRDADGLYRKYRVMTVDGTLYPLHLAFARDWKVHYFSSEMFEHADLRERERAFLDDMAGTLGARAIGALQSVAKMLDLDYAGIDFTLDRDGRVVVFEANAAMTVVPPDGDERFAYRVEPTQRVVDAMAAMVERRLTGPRGAGQPSGRCGA
jgi:tetratricopeptide (TPR) repeat protein